MQRKDEVGENGAKEVNILIIWMNKKQPKWREKVLYSCGSDALKSEISFSVCIAIVCL